MVYLVLRLEIPRMSCMNIFFFDTRLIGLEVLDLVPDYILAQINSWPKSFELREKEFFGRI